MYFLILAAYDGQWVLASRSMLAGESGSPAFLLRGGVSTGLLERERVRFGLSVLLPALPPPVAPLPSASLCLPRPLSLLIWLAKVSSMGFRSPLLRSARELLILC